MKQTMSKELNLAIEAAKKAGEFLGRKEDIRVDSMIGKDIKLSSDKMSEKIILDILEKTGIPILSEECGLKKETVDTHSGRCWIVDPLDGTMNYYRGLDDLACVSIALWEKDKPVLGVVYRFMSEELYFGEIGMGAYANDRELQPSATEHIDQAVLATGFPVKRAYDEDSLKPYIRRTQLFKKVRMLGAAAIMATYVPCGKIDVYEEDGIMLWDIAGAVAIANAAGCSHRVERQNDFKVRCLVCANHRLMEEYDAQSL